MADSPAISVLMRTMGLREALKDALASLRAQTFRNFEIVIVEDGADTLTPFLAGYADLPIRYEPLGQWQGRTAAGNHALSVARGEYFIFLDDDDLFAPDHLKNLIKKAQSGPHRIVYSWSQERRVERAEDGRILGVKRFHRVRREPFSLLQFIVGNFIPINAVLFHRSLYKAAGGFDSGIDRLEDWLLWMRYAAIEPDWINVPHATAIYNVPVTVAARRREFHASQSAIHNHLETIKVSWPLVIVQRDLQRHFRPALFIRRLYYYFLSFI